MQMHSARRTIFVFTEQGQRHGFGKGSACRLNAPNRGAWAVLFLILEFGSMEKSEASISGNMQAQPIESFPDNNLASGHHEDRQTKQPSVITIRSPLDHAARPQQACYWLIII